MAESQDVDTLKRRGRRRLVGAVALVLLAVIVLPMLFDPEPRRPAPPVSVRIPGEDESGFAPKLAPKAPDKKREAAAPPPAEKKAEAESKPEPKPAESKPEPEPKAAEAKSEQKAAQSERARAEAALADAQYVIPVGAFTNASAVTARLAAAKLPYYTEAVATAKGTVTRVRAGPFASKEAADQAMQKLKGLGFKPGNVAAKSG
jgi:DedD protein